MEGIFGSRDGLERPQFQGTGAPKHLDRIPNSGESALIPPLDNPNASNATKAMHVAKHCPLGMSVDMFSRSKNAWIPGKVIDVDTKAGSNTGDVTVSYSDGSGQKKVKADQINALLRKCTDPAAANVTKVGAAELTPMGIKAGPI